jgi:DNA invertase Pin-like site-specific DNA recombinase
MKAIILARVSTEEQKQAGNSLPSQVFRLQKYARDKGLKIVQEFTFDESAYKTKRAEFSNVIELLRASKEPMALCCDKIDRLIRNFTKDLVLLEELRQQGKLEIHFPSDNITLHKDSPATDLFRFTIGVSLSKYYSDSIRDNVKRAFEQKIRNGEWPDHAPIGYKNIDKDDDKKDIIVDSERSHYVVRLFELYSTGQYSMQQLKDKLTKEGLTNTRPPYRPLTKSQIAYVLENPFYYGFMRYKGELHQHRYPAIISKELYDKCQEVRLGWGKKRFKYASIPFIFRGLIKCADCGCTITPERKKGKYVYYHCTQYKGKHNAEFVKEEDLLVQVSGLLKQIAIPDDVLEQLITDLKSNHESKIAYHHNSMDSLKAEYDRYEKRLEVMYQDRLDGRITTDEYDKLAKEFYAKKEDLLIQMEDHNKADKNYYLASSMILKLANKAYKLFESSKDKQKRQLLSLILQNCQLAGKKLEFSLKMPFDVILQCSKSSEWLATLV